MHCRRFRRPAILHLSCVRLLGHAGSDVDSAYRSPAEIDAAERRDPVLRAALDLIAAGVLDAEDVLSLEARAAERVAAEAERAVGRPKLTTRSEVMAPLARPIAPALEREAARSARPLSTTPLTLAQGINLALGEALDRYPQALVFGEDVAKKGGVYGVTKGLFARSGPLRVFNTLLDEQTILGIALGSATLGLLPIPEIQYLAYLHNAEDQLRGEASTMQFFSNGAYDNPMLLRIAGLGYQKGFGGHFHNDNALGVLRDIPGIVLIVPSRADDAVELYRSALALAVGARRVLVSVEPIALYHERDLYEPGDSAWLATPGAGISSVPSPRVYHEQAQDLLIVSYGNGVHLGLRAARRLEREHRIESSVIDLRWLSPLPIETVLEHARRVGRVLMVDEGRRSGGVSEALCAALLDAQAPGIRAARVTSADSFIPLGEAANLVLVSEQEIVDAALGLLRQ
jgi:2-oxoisovalerate dehydrogenase E1 component